MNESKCQKNTTECNIYLVKACDPGYRFTRLHQNIGARSALLNVYSFKSGSGLIAACPQYLFRLTLLQIITLRIKIVK